MTLRQKHKRFFSWVDKRKKARVDIQKAEKILEETDDKIESYIGERYWNDGQKLQDAAGSRHFARPDNIFGIED